MTNRDGSADGGLYATTRGIAAADSLLEGLGYSLDYNSLSEAQKRWLSACQSVYETGLDMSHELRMELGNELKMMMVEMQTKQLQRNQQKQQLRLNQQKSQFQQEQMDEQN